MLLELVLKIGGAILGIVLALSGVWLFVYFVRRPELLLSNPGDPIGGFTVGGFVFLTLGLIGGGVFLLLFSVGVITV